MRPCQVFRSDRSHERHSGGFHLELQYSGQKWLQYNDESSTNDKLGVMVTLVPKGGMLAANVATLTLV